MSRRWTVGIVLAVALAGCGDGGGPVEPEQDDGADTTSTGFTVRAAEVSIQARLEPHPGFDRWTFGIRMSPGQTEAGPRATQDTVVIDGTSHALWGGLPHSPRFAVIEIEIPSGEAHLTPLRIQPPRIEGLDLPDITIAGFSRLSDTVRRSGGGDLVLPMGIPASRLIPDAMDVGWGVGFSTGSGPVTTFEGRRYPGAGVRIPADLLPDGPDPYTVTFGLRSGRVLESVSGNGWSFEVEYLSEQAWTVVTNDG